MKTLLSFILFLDHQRESGLISRSVPSNQFHDPEHVRPFLAQITKLVFDNYNDTRLFTKEYFHKMKKYPDTGCMIWTATRMD